MKKSSKIFGGLAVSAALVMGTAVPAFADTTSDPSVDTDMDTKTGAQTALTQGTDKSQGTGETTVNISTYTSQISVTVPLSVQFALDTTGGAGYAPSNYKIVNNTVVPVTVEKAVASEGTMGDYAFGAAKFASAGTTKTAGTIGEVYAKFTPAAGSTNSVELASAKKDADQTLNWTIGAAVAAGSTVDVATDGTNSYTLQQLKDDWAGDRNFVNTVVSGANSTVINGATSLSDLTLNSGWTISTKTAGGTEYPINITDTSSSVLVNAAPITNNAAKIVYTVKVA